MHKLEQNLNRTDPSNGSVYTGHAGTECHILVSVIFICMISGMALLYLRLATLFPDQRSQYISKAKSLIDLALRLLDGRHWFYNHSSLDPSSCLGRVATFLCGDSGPLAIGAAIYHQLGDQKTVDKCIQKIVSLRSEALRSSTPDEHLYGRAGYLYALMFLRREIGPQVVDTQLITDVFQTMIKSGENYARETRSQSPLMYKWHDSEYMGGAHGVSGIVYFLLKVKFRSRR